MSDERDAILETGGGVKKALPLLGDAPFFVTNVDSLWLEGVRPNLALLAHDGLEGARARLLLASATASLGYDGRGDFAMDQDARLTRRKEHEMAPFTYAGTLLTTPSAFADMPDGAWSLNRLFDAALEEEALLGIRMDGLWMHVGTPRAVEEAEAAIEEKRRVGGSSFRPRRIPLIRPSGTPDRSPEQAFLPKGRREKIFNVKLDGASAATRPCQLHRLTGQSRVLARSASAP